MVSLRWLQKLESSFLIHVNVHRDGVLPPGSDNYPKLSFWALQTQDYIMMCLLEVFRLKDFSATIEG